MMDRDMKVTCIWRTDEFVVSESKSQPTEDEAYLIIDESTEKITVFIPTHYSIINKRIIERRVQSVAKSGFLIPKSTIRLGMGFDVSITKEEKIPDVLLQVGHHYSFETPTSPYIETEVSAIATAETISEPVIKTETQIEAEIPIVKADLGDNETIAGRLVIALAKTGDLYLSRSKTGYSVEYSQGRVDFTVQNGDIQILATKRITENDQTLNQAVEAAKR
jgi:hypothetical protein